MNKDTDHSDDAILLPAAAFTGKKKDKTDWLDAPTPDGSPTLKETSDWLAKTLNTYAGVGNNQDGKYGSSPDEPVYESVSINNQCEFSFVQVPINDRGRRDRRQALQTIIPLGAVLSVGTDPNTTSTGAKWTS